MDQFLYLLFNPRVGLSVQCIYSNLDTLVQLTNQAMILFVGAAKSTATQ